MSKFYKNDLTADTLWRSIISIGANNKSYKFALGKSLIHIAEKGKATSVSIKDLAPIFANYTVEHVRNGKKQGVDDKKKGEFLIACENFIDNKINFDQLINVTEKKAFADVITRFHTVNSEPTSIKFYDDSEFASNKTITIRDDVFKLLSSKHGTSLIHEIEARWNLVETAWELGVAQQLLNVEYDDESSLFFVRKNEKGQTRRIDVTRARDSLNTYQKGHCFFCFDFISVNSNDSNVCHVDHFFPHTLFDRTNSKINYNGLWNLVLSCKECNLKKSAKLPILIFLKRLHNRNEFYVESHLPLKETILQTGNSLELRINFLQTVYNESQNHLISTFDSPAKYEARF